MATLADRIRAARIDAGIHEPAELARRVRVKPAAAYQWESGATKSLKAETAITLADALNINIRWLVTGKGSKSPDAAPAAIDRDVLRQSVAGAERIIRGNGMAKTVSDDERARIVAAVYVLRAEGLGIDRAEDLVTGTLRALANPMKVS